MGQHSEQVSLFEKKVDRRQPVTCLGMIFESESARRAYFTDELRRRLPALREMEGFPIGSEEDILALSDPPYYTVCPNPFLPEILKEWEEMKEEPDAEEPYRREPFAADVSEGKNDPIYNAHSYHTKVPHKAIMRYILHYTRPGDIVFDGFAGTGMTGVAAQLCGDRKEVESLGYRVEADGTILDEEGRPFSKLGPRRAILNDLSPAASFIAYNYNTPVDVEAFEQEARRILEEVEAECGWMYETRHVVDGEPQAGANGEPIIGRINYTVWSDVFLCPHCAAEMIFWEVAVDQQAGKVRDHFQCPGCGAEHTKRSVERAWETRFDVAIGETVRQAKQVPVLINYSVGRKRYEKRPDADDLALIRRIEEMEIPYWFPKARIPEGDKTGDPVRIGITHVHHFYTQRNLLCLSRLYDLASSRERVSLRLKHWLNAIEHGVSKRVKHGNWSFPMSILSGTLYIPGQNRENTPLNLYFNKYKRLLKAFSKTRYTRNSCIVSNQSSSYIHLIKSHSIDYIFTDPPFGANLMYSELNFLWEAWLKVFTNNRTEAVVNQTQGKGLVEYQRLMEACFKEYYRVLKPGRWMTVEFSNSQASVWNAIQEAIQRAGFVIAHVAALDKKQGSFNAVTTTTAVKQDLIISAYKPSEEMVKEIRSHQGMAQSAWGFIENHLRQLPVFLGRKGQAETIVERMPRVLYDRMVAYHVQHGYPVPLSSAEFQQELAQRFSVRDGMVFLQEQVAEYDKKRLLAKEFVQLNLFVADENSAIEWLRQQLMNKPQTRQELYTPFLREIQHIASHERLPELDDLLAQNFLCYEGEGPVPSQIHSYLSSNYKDLRGLGKEDAALREKAKGRWYVPDPNKQADLERLRERALLREFQAYLKEVATGKKRLKEFRTEAIRFGFKKAWREDDYQTIVRVGERLPEKVLQEDDKLLMYYDNALIRLGQ
ncbi:DNA methyltransferase [Kyrpidia tusciae]|uniref:DNA methylase N-4/N-6 domain protein n=1 Tax=Kyrpidia tusciae (strain DSM 2912 / NBRC 15312 / T2) TaxID=562970 RepID=D5WT58_KYRT2|nr:DNA methyltransferase [Kyrpidia tusciae]ADG05162.1 DNA methylase N-4/N-6 domain protein [Kyrpidia tusciae DSM 2912]